MQPRMAAFLQLWKYAAWDADATRLRTTANGGVSTTASGIECVYYGQASQNNREWRRFYNVRLNELCQQLFSLRTTANGGVSTTLG